MPILSCSFVGSKVDSEVPRESDMRGIPLHNDPPKYMTFRQGLMDKQAKGQPATASVLTKAREDQMLTGEGCM